MKKVEKKIWPKFFEEIKKGKKTFDIRIADFRCKSGDILVLREWNPKTKKYTGRVLEKKVNYVLRTKNLKFFTKDEINKYGYQVIGFKK